MSISQSSVTVAAREVEAVWSDWQFDVVWLRRFSATRLGDEVAAVDRPFAELESYTFLKALLFSFADRGRWINTPAAKDKAQHKPDQLRCAAASGLLIPDTLITNSKEDALGFLTANAGKVVAKQFHPIEWKTSRGIAKSRTTRVSARHLEQWRPFELAPTIFQRAVEKAYEVRITVIGGDVIGARLDVVGDGAGHVDWRLARVSGQRLEAAASPVPEGIRTCIMEMMRRLGLAFGCVDAIVTPDGEFYFLEVNEMGQFLWLDDLCPELVLLGKFSSFLVHGTTARFDEFPRYGDYAASGHWPAWLRTAEAKYPQTPGRYIGDER